MSILKSKNLTKGKDLRIFVIFLIIIIVVLAYIYRERIFTEEVWNIINEKLEKYIGRYQSSI